MQNNKFKTVDDYIQSFPLPVRKKLAQMRKIIRKNAPKAEEKISYNMPAFSLNGVLVYYAAFSSHIGFYPLAGGVSAFKNKLAKYRFAKGSIQFPLDEPLPVGLIEKIVLFRVKENLKKTKKG